MRLDKFLCETVNVSRKDAKESIKKGLLMINGNIIKDPGFIVSEESDSVFYMGNELKYEKFVYYMLNKPAGYVCANKDNVSDTVIDLFKEENRDDIFCVGRLDKDTVGLLIVTNDGDLSHHLTSPRHHIEKTYYVRSKKKVTSEQVDRISEGLDIGDNDISKPAKVEILSDFESLITISEGMFHEVKRIYKAVDNEVIFLKRISIGKLLLDESLEEGKYRRLSDEELKFLKEG